MLTIQGIPLVQGTVVVEPTHLVICVLAIVLVHMIIGVVVKDMMDFWKVPVQKITGTILEKVYRPALESEYPDGKGGTIYRCIGPTHMIKVKLPLDNEPTTGIVIKQEVYDAIKEGDQVVLDFKRGKKTGNLRILEVSLA